MWSHRSHDRWRFQLRRHPEPPVSVSDVTQLRFANALDGYAFDPELWETTNGGASWVHVRTAGQATEVAAADGEAYVVECALGTTCRSTDLLRSLVGSGEWQKVSTPISLGGFAQFAVSGPNLYVQAGNEQQNVLLYSADKGASFSERVGPCTRSLPDCRVTAAADGSPTLWAASPTGTMAAVLLSTNGGVTWRIATPTGEFANSLGLTAASSSVALAWPGPEVSDARSAAMARTMNGGGSYSAVLSSSGSVLWAGFSDPVRAYALVVTASGQTQIFESNDGGATWHQVVIKR
jgi:hypothetical protein